MSQEECSDRGKGSERTGRVGVFFVPYSTKNTVRQEGEEEGRMVKEQYHYPSNRMEKWTVTKATLLNRCRNINNKRKLMM